MKGIFRAIGVVVLTFLLVVSLTVCGGDGDNGEDEEKISVPKNFTVELSPDKRYLTLSWDGSPDADEYWVERKSEDDSDFNVICVVSHPDTECHDYEPTRNPQYRVYAWSSSGGKSEYSITVFVNTYESAKLYVYICPDFYNGCAGNYFNLNGNCRQIAGLELDSWYDTGFEIVPGKSYAIAHCTGCPGPCGSPISFETPEEAFFSYHYCPGVFFYCNTPCNPSEACPD